MGAHKGTMPRVNLLASKFNFIVDDESTSSIQVEDESELQNRPRRRGRQLGHYVLYCSVNPLRLCELFLFLLTPVPPALRVQTQTQIAID